MVELEQHSKEIRLPFHIEKYIITMNRILSLTPQKELAPNQKTSYTKSSGIDSEPNIKNPDPPPTALIWDLTKEPQSGFPHSLSWLSSPLLAMPQERGKRLKTEGLSCKISFPNDVFKQLQRTEGRSRERRTPGAGEATEWRRVHNLHQTWHE